MNIVSRLVRAVILIAAGAMLPASAFGASWTIPGVANTPGANNTNFQSDLSITNTSGSFASLTLTFIPQAGGPEREPKVVTLNAEETVTYVNVLQQLWGLFNTGGAIRITSNASSLAFNATTYNNAPTGSFSLALPAIEDFRLLQPGQVGHSAWVSKSPSLQSGYRTNIAVVFPDTAGGSATVSLFDQTGAVVGSKSYDFAKATFIQESAAAYTSAPVMVGRITITPTRGPSFGYTAVVDNVTGDGSVFPSDVAPSGTTDVVLTGVGRTPGGGGTYWQTDLRIFNPSSQAASVQAFFLRPLQSGLSATPFIFTVAPGAVVEFIDVLKTFFNAPDGSAGALRIASPAPLIILARTSNLDPTGVRPGTFGSQQLPTPVSTFLSSIDFGGTVPGVTVNNRTRTNLEFTSGPSGAAFTIQLLSPSGTVLGQVTDTLLPFSYSQKSVALTFPGITIPEDSRILVTVQSGSLTFGGSIIDGASGDPVIVPMSVRRCNPPVLTFTLPPSVCAGNGYTLVWNADDPTARVTIDGIGSNLPASGSQLFSLATAPRTFTGRASNVCGTGASTSATIRVTGSAKVQSFTASLNPGTTQVRLDWSTTDADSVSITGVGSGLPASGSRLVNISQSTTFVLTASNSCSSDSSSQTVNINCPLPVIQTLTAGTTAVPPGAQTTITFSLGGVTGWSITSSTGNTIAPSSGSGSGTFTVSFTGVNTGSDTVTLNVVNSCGAASRTITINVASGCTGPVIGSLTATPANVQPGGTSTIAFTLENTVSWTISSALANGLSATSGTGSGPVSLTYTGTNLGSDVLTLVATNACGSTTRTVSLVVQSGCQNPVITTFSATPAAVNPGGSVALNFSLTNALSWTLSSSAGNLLGASSGTGSGPFTVNLTGNNVGTDTITLTATNACGSVTQTATVVVANCELPNISTLSVSPSAISNGAQATVSFSLGTSASWTLTSALGNTFNPPNGSGAGSFTSTYTGTNSGTDTITLSVTNACATTSATTTISVQAGCVLPTVTNLISTPSTTGVGGSTVITFSLVNSTTWTLESQRNSSFSQTTGSGPGDFSVNYTATGGLPDVVTLRATNACGTTQQTLTINCVPSVDEFTATPSTINLDQTSILNFRISNNSGGTWRLTSALGNTFAQTVGSGNGTFNVNYTGAKSGNDTVTLTVTNGCGTTTQTVPVVVQTNCPLPTITTFTSSATTINQGATAALSFTIANASSWQLASAASNGLSLTTGTGSGTFNVTYTGTKVGPDTITLTVTNGCGSINQQIPITVQQNCPLATITNFFAGSSTIQRDQTTQITFTLSSANSWRLTSSLGNTISQTLGSGNGTFTVNYTASKIGSDTITLAVTNTCGTANASITITIQPNCTLPSVANFFANQATLTQGQATTITFAISDTLNWNLTSSLGNSLSQTIGTGSGAFTVNYNATRRGSDTITLRLTNSCGEVTQSISIIVN